LAKINRIETDKIHHEMYGILRYELLYKLNCMYVIL